LSDSREGGSSSLSSTGLPAVAVLKDNQDFAALAEEWTDLYDSSPLATPFQSWSWLYSWWELYGEGYELRLVTMRDDGLLVGIAPLMLERRRVLSRLLFIGTGITDYLDILVRQGWEARVYKVGVQALGQMDAWQVADLQQLRPGAAAWSLFREWDGPRARVWQDNFPLMEVKPWDELLMSLSRNLRSTVRRTLRRIEEDGVQSRLVGLDDAERAAGTLVALHREAWQGRDIALEHQTRRFEAFLKTTARRMMACGLGSISEFWRDEKVIISHFLVFGNDFVGTYLQGASQEALQRYQFSSLYIWNATDISCSRNRRWVDLLRGEEPYKLRWNPKIIANYRLILGRSPAFWSLYTGYHALYSKARRYSSARHAPKWVKDAAKIYSVLRNAGQRYVNQYRKHS
jgi:CelD/BcsL family acetyltransferase involved in cellulose biosynthesis